MKKFVLAIISVFFITFLASCSDDKATTPDTEQGTGFPLAEGNWWKFNTFEIDSNGNTKTAVKNTYTSTLGPKITIDGREAYDMISTDDEGDEDNNYISADENGVYSYISPEVDDDGNVTPGFWVKLIDFKNSNWDIASEDIDEEGDGYKQTGTRIMKGAKKGTSNVTYKGKSYTATTYLNIITSDVTTETLVDDKWETESRIYSDTLTNVLIGGIGYYSIVDFNITSILSSGREIDVLIDHKVK